MVQAQGVNRKTQLKCHLLGEDFLDHPNFHENQGILYSPPSGIPKALRRVRLKMHLCMLSHPVVSNFLQPHGLYPPKLLCPWDSPGKNTTLGCQALLQGILLTQGSNPCVLHWQVGSLPLAPPGKPSGILPLWYPHSIEKGLAQGECSLNSG